jgi:hypothetical protein
MITVLANYCASNDLNPICNFSAKQIAMICRAATLSIG